MISEGYVINTRGGFKEGARKEVEEPRYLRTAAVLCAYPFGASAYPFGAERAAAT
jgi:hypothetical protein